METFGTPPETLDDAFVAPELAESEKTAQDKALKGASAATGLARPRRDQTGSGSGLAGTQENGVDVSAGEGGLFGGNETRGVSRSSKKRENEEAAGVGLGSRRKAVQGLGSVFGAKKNEENGLKKIEVGDRSVSGTDNVSGKKVEFDSDGISLVVEVRGSMANNEQDSTFKLQVKNAGNLGKKSGYEDGKATVPENGQDPDGEVSVSMADVSRDKDVEEDVVNRKQKFSVGDFVWGKIKSHPWWPGQIYNPSDASQYAAKYKQGDRFLVAYFGDGSFAWCYPSQLEPFEENFESMSKQSNSKNFVNAVHKAVVEIGRLVELKMTCSCKQKENQFSLARPLAANAGIKEGVSVPESSIGKLSVAQYEPADLLAELRNMAQVVSVNSLLQFTVLTSWLSAFYRAKGGYQLPMFHEPQLIADPEDNSRNPLMGVSGFMEIPIQGPVEEHWLSSPVSPGNGQTSHSSLQKYPGISEDKLYQRRKQKSMAELMGGDMHTEPENNGGDTAREGTHLSKLASASGKKKRKDSVEAESHGGNIFTSPLGRRGRKTKLSVTRENKDSSDENGGSEGKEESKKGPVSSGRKKRKGSSVENDGGEAIKETEKGNVLREKEKNKGSSFENDSGEAKEETKKGLLSRERKKSKYLSPPYTTNLKQRQGHSSSKRAFETEFLQVSNVTRIGRRMTRAAGLLTGTPPILKCSSETFQEKLSQELGVGHRTMDSPSTPALKEDKSKIIDLKASGVSPNDVLSELQSAAINLQYSRGNKSHDMIGRFFSIFRSSIYRDGSNYKVYNKIRPGRKRKSLDLEPGSMGKNLNQIDDNSHKSKIRWSRIKKTEEGSAGKHMNESDDHAHKQKARQARVEKKAAAELDVSKLKQAPVASDVKTNNKKTDGKASSAILYVSFPPAVSLPSKDDLITIYSKFGALNEMETDILYNSFCGRVVFVRTADAEQAFENSVKSSPFGAVKVNFRLRYPSAPPRTNEVNNRGGRTPENPSATESSVGEASQLNFIKQKLEMMTSMLEKSDGKMSREMKSNLEGEMKGLLEKVSTMAKSSSS